MLINVTTWERAAMRATDEKEFLHLASTPNDEPCTQAGSNFDDQRKECKALINQLRRYTGSKPKASPFVYF